jgi:3-methylcrotonyl-CoA carboxylase alpha subunit
MVVPECTVKSIRKLLIANRGEIAVRIIRACRELDIVAVAVYSDIDRDALHVRLADEAFPIGPAPAVESYLCIDAIIGAARAAQADAIHPGYGFLSERAAFAEACAAAGLIFVGPPPAAIALMGSKIAAKRLATANDVPVVPGYDGDDQDPRTLVLEAERIGFPLLIKASAGGGGKGMRVVHSAGDFTAALEGAQREALAAFGDGTVFLEKLIVRPRHVEFQIFADDHGNVVHLGERECSIQRRHQKILEEAPCVALDSALRDEMGAAAVRLARAANYRNAGTVEFMLDPDGNYYFLEMNTRLQVEHPVTELITGRDLVHLQLAVAVGEPLPFRQSDVQFHGHAIEVRVYAEDPTTFLPAAGPVAVVVAPDGPGIRNDLGLAGGDTVPVHYDPMVAKLSVFAPNRSAAVARLSRAVDDYAVLGLVTNLALLRAIAMHPAFAAGATHTDFLEETGLPAHAVSLDMPAEVLAAAALAAASPPEQEPDPFAVLWRAGGGPCVRRFEAGGATHTVVVSGHDGQMAVEVDRRLLAVEVVARRGPMLTLRFGTRQERFYVAVAGDTLYIQWHARHYRIARAAPLSVESFEFAAQSVAGHDSLTAPMSGTIVKILVKEGETVAAHQPLVVLEAMKMEHTIVAPYDGVVTRVSCDVGTLVDGGTSLVELDADPQRASQRT